MSLDGLPIFCLYQVFDDINDILRKLEVRVNIDFYMRTSDIKLDFGISEAVLQLNKELKFDLIETPKGFEKIIYKLVYDLNERDPVRTQLNDAFLRYIPTSRNIYDWEFMVSTKRGFLIRGKLFKPFSSVAHNVEIYIQMTSLYFLRVHSVTLINLRTESTEKTEWKINETENLLTSKVLKKIRRDLNRIITRRNVEPARLAWIKNNVKDLINPPKFFSLDLQRGLYNDSD